MEGGFEVGQVGIGREGRYTCLGDVVGEGTCAGPHHCLDFLIRVEL
jgi:hypothetical protein